MIEIAPIPADQSAGSGDFRFSLDSGGGASPWDRWSYHPHPATRILQCDSCTLVTTLRSADRVERRWDDPLHALAWLGDQACETPTPGPPFKGGWLGYLSYDLGRLLENLPNRAADDLQLPLFTFTHHDRVTAIDHATKTAFDCRITPRSPQSPLQFANSYQYASHPPVPDLTRAEYEAAVRCAIDYIAAGDIFQVNLAQRFTAGLPCAPACLYEILRHRYPAWFGAFLDYGDHALLCNSPELFLQITPCEGHRSILTRPIKGTRPRGVGLEAELRHSAKDQAELNMIVDLQRNDLGRVCEIGSVKVAESRVIETHPTVFHGVATIEGMLRSDVTFVDLLRATFPGGSVTGAPKIRAMEIIEELEPVRRGPYCGAIGYLSADGHMQFNVAIRTMIAKDDRVHISVGAGIVADSIPSAEYDETMVKAKAMFDVLDWVRNDEIRMTNQ